MHQLQTNRRSSHRGKAEILVVDASKQTLFFYTMLCSSLNRRQVSQHTVQVSKPSVIKLFHKILQQEQIQVWCG